MSNDPAALPPADAVDSPSTQRKRWVVTLLAMTLPLAVCFVYFVWLPGTVIGKVAYTGIKLWLLLWPVAVGLWILREPAADKGRWYNLARLLPAWPAPPGKAVTPRARKASILAGVGFGVAVAIFAGIVLSIPDAGAAIKESGPQLRKQVVAFGVMDYYFVFGVFIAVLHSALEEFYWRGFVFGNLRRLVPIWAAHLLASLAFMAHHVVVLHTFFPSHIAWMFSAGVAAGGLAWSYLYHRHGTLVGAWVSHLIADVTVVAIGWHLMNG